MTNARILGAFAAVALGSVTLPQSAIASTLLFSFTGPDGTASWTQPSTPTPLDYGLNGYTHVPVTADGPDSLGNEFFDVYFYEPVDSGGFTLGPLDIQEAGAQEYAGPASAPLFAPGVYATTTYDNGDTGLPGGVLTITAVPEPSVWLILGLGFGALGLSLRASREGARLSA
jgi:hypothetical protein